MKRRIFSILFALMLVLNFSLVMAAPAAANVTSATVAISPAMATAGFVSANYTITDNVSATGNLTANTSNITIMFPADTVITPSALAGTVNGSAITVITGNNTTGNVTFTTPVTVPNSGTFVVNLTAGITNPTVAGPYTLTVATGVELTPVISQSYHIFSVQTPVNLLTTADFAALAETHITTTGTTKIIGDIGISPAASTFITGFGLVLDSSTTFSTSSLVTGQVFAASYTDPTPAKMTQAINDLGTAYTDAASGGRTPDATELGAGHIGGMTLAPGCYKWSTDVLIETDVTLSGNSTAVWIFQIAGDLTVSNGKQVLLSGGAEAKNIFWQVGGGTGATLGTTSVVNGNILSNKQVIMNSGATLNGRALAKTQVTLIANTITMPSASALTITAAPSVTTGNAAATYTVNFTTTKDLTVGDRIVITFPGGFNASGALVDATTTTPSGHDPTLVSATTTVVTTNVTAAEAPGAFSIVLTGIVNTQTAGTAYVVSVKTLDSPAFTTTLDGPTASAPFTITTAGVATLTVQVQPTRTTSGIAIVPPVQVKSVDAAGAVVASQTVTASLQVGTGALSGNTTQLTDVLGIATFDDLSINLGGTNKVLGFTTGAASINSTAFTVTHITVNPTSGLVTTGGTATFTIVLDAAPTANVTIGLSSNDTTKGTVSPASVTFTTVNWATPRTITVTGSINDTVVNANYTIVTANATSTDTKYNDLNASDVGVINLANTTPIGGGGGGGAPTLDTSLFGVTGSFNTNSAGVVQTEIKGTSADGKLTIDIPKGTIALDKNGSPLLNITATVNANPPPPPQNANIIGLAYNFLPAGATFSPGIIFKFTVSPASIIAPLTVNDLVLAFYSETSTPPGWVTFPTSVVPGTFYDLQATVSHFTTFAVIAYASPAAFTASNLVITPAEVNTGVASTIKVTVANNGDLSGTYNVVLKVNGAVTETKSVTLAGKSSTDVTFVVSPTTAGTYTIDVNGLTGALTVKALPTTTPPTTTPPTTTPTLTPTPTSTITPAPTSALPVPSTKSSTNWLLICEITGGVILVGLLIFFFIRSVVRRRGGM
jgi:hypothetical protein